MVVINTKDSSITPARDMTALTGNTQQTDPYSTFSNNISSMLTTLQKTNTAGNAALGGAANALTNQSITGNNKTFDPTVMSGSQVQNQQSLQNAFIPAISSLNTQIANNNESIKNIGDFANTTLGNMKGQFSTYYDQIQGKMMKVNSNTGEISEADSQAQGGNQSQGQPITDTAKGIINGYDFSGKSVGMGAYATSDPNGENLNHSVQQVVRSVPTPSAEAYDQYIGPHAKGSPVTGSMIMTAASGYGVDPNVLAGVLQQESDFGTAGMGAKTMNPGNVGNTGASNQTFNSWQQGVNAVAENLKKRMTTGGTQINSNNQNSGAPTGLAPFISSLASQVKTNKTSSDAAFSRAGSAFGVAGITALQNSLGQDFNSTVSNTNASSISDLTSTVNKLSAAKASVANISNDLISQIAKNKNLNPSDINVVNQAIQLVASNTSNADYQTLVNQMTDIVATYGTILNPQGTTETTRAQASSLVDQLAKGSTVSQVIKSLDDQANQKIAGIQDTIKRLGTGENVNPAGAVAGQSGLPKVGDVKAVQGVNYTFDGKQWNQTVKPKETPGFLSSIFNDVGHTVFPTLVPKQK